MDSWPAPMSGSSAGVHVGGPEPREVGGAVTGTADGVVQRGSRAGGVEGAGAEGAVEVLGHGDRGPVADLTESADDMAVPGQLEGGGQVNRLVGEGGRAGDSGLAGGQVG